MKKIIDLIGDAIVELMVLSLVIIFPLASLCGIVLGCFDKITKRQ